MNLRPFALVVPLLLVAVALGGCAEKSGTTSATVPTEATATSTTGAIEGVLVDEEQAPVVGATVGIRLVGGGKENQTVSSPGGVFAFSGLEPAEYELVVQSPFFEAASRKVMVIAGEIIPASFTLKRLPQVGPMVEMVPLKGYIACNVGWRNPTNPTTSGGNPVNSNLCYKQQGDKSTFPLPFDLTRKLVEVVIEMVWQPGTGFSGSALRMEMCGKTPDENNYVAQCNIVSGNKPYRGATVVGKPPLVLRRNDMPLATVKEYILTIGDGGYDLADPTGMRVPVTFQQNVDIYVSMCYNDNCTVDYTARPPV